MGSSPIGHPISPRKWQAPALDCAGSSGAARAALTSAALAQVAANVTGAIEGRDPEYLHQLRVGIRRLRTVFRIFKAKRLDKQLRKLARPLGEARDWDVFVAQHEQGAAGRRAAHRRSRRVLQSAEFRAFIVEAQQIDARASGAPLPAFAAKALARLHRKALKRARKIDWRKEKRRHRVRIAVRRLRYASDFFSPCFPELRAYARRLERLQDLLGELNDIAVARRLGGIDQPEGALIRRLASAWRAFDTERLPVAAR